MVNIIWWLTVFAYLATAVFCLLCTRRERSSAGLWSGIALSLLLMGINKQQDLTGWLTTFGRNQAWLGDWYGDRGSLQFFLIGLFFIIVTALFVVLIHFFHPANHFQWSAMVGVAFLFIFTVIRAVSLHSIDKFLYEEIRGIQPNWLLEIGGIALVVIPALRTLRSSAVLKNGD